MILRQSRTNPHRNFTVTLPPSNPRHNHRWFSCVPKSPLRRHGGMQLWLIAEWATPQNYVEGGRLESPSAHKERSSPGRDLTGGSLTRSQAINARAVSVSKQAPRYAGCKHKREHDFEKGIGHISQIGLPSSVVGNVHHSRKCALRAARLSNRSDVRRSNKQRPHASRPPLAPG
jgi:hypothetical protein